MAKYCSICGQYSDDTAYVCAACGAPFRGGYDDDSVTVVADDAFTGDAAPAYPQPDPAPAPTPAPAYSQPDPAPAYQQPAPQPAPAYRQPVQTNTYQPTVPRGTAVPLNMASPKMAVPLQQQTAPAKKNKGMALGITITAVIAAVVIAAVVLIIVLTGNNSSNTGGGGGGTVSTQSLQGNYVLNSQTYYGTRIGRDELPQYYGGDLMLTVGSDNVGTLSAVDGSTDTITFDPSDHTAESSGSIGTYTLSGNTLTVTMEDGNVISEFIRQ